jgi:hypothetical protein
MNSVKLTALAAILLTISLVSTSSAQPANPCGNQATPPTVTSGAVISPQLAMGGIQYVAGDAVRVQVVTDGCTDLQSIQIGSVTLTPAQSSSGTLPNYYWYSSIDTQNNATAHGYLMWLGFPTIADGSTDEVTVTVVRSGGTGTAAYAFPLVHVSSIQPGADAATGISAAEIQNSFAQSLHDKFSGPNNSAVMSGTTVDYDPASLVTYIDSTGVWLSFRLKAETTCKPIISVTGTFVLETNSTGFSVVWVNPATAYVESTWCTVIVGALGELAHWITFGLVGAPGSVGSVQQQLTQEIMSSLPNVGSAGALLDGSTTQSGQLLVDLKVPVSLAPSVEIDVPYSAFDVPRTPMRFPPGQAVGLVANGLGMSDLIAGESANARLASGPNGVPLHTSTTLSNQYTVARTGALVDGGAQVGQLLARLPSFVARPASDFRYAPGCKVTASAGTVFTGPPEILFGVNDTAADAQRLRAAGATGYKVRIIFGLAGSACVSPPAVVGINR